jgi:hypothetical protein
MRSGDAARGKVELGLVIGGCVLAFLLTGTVARLRSGEGAPVSMLGRPIILALLGALAWQGRAWARTVAAVWVGLIAIVYAIGAVPIVGQSMVGGMVMLALAATLGAAAFRLQTSPNIDALVQRRREGARRESQ